jgi:hypothetical protein
MAEKYYAMVFIVPDRTFMEGSSYKTWMLFKKSEQAVIEEILHVKDKPQKVKRIFTVDEYGRVEYLELISKNFELQLAPIIKEM